MPVMTDATLQAQEEVATGASSVAAGSHQVPGWLGGNDEGQRDQGEVGIRERPWVSPTQTR